jgi:hypothetical protein
MVFNGPSATKNRTLSNENMSFLRSKLSTWPQIGKIHMKEIDHLQQRVNALYLTLPKPETPTTPTPETQHFKPEPYSPDTMVRIPQTEYQSFQKTMTDQ